MGRFPVLTENKDFKTAYYHGASAVASLLVTYARKNRIGVTRIGITVSKKVGKAVVRSRCRRVIRAAYASLAPQVAAGYDLVFVARGRTAESTAVEVAAVMRQQLSTLHVLERDPREDRL